MIWSLSCFVAPFLISIGQAATIPVPSSTGPCDVTLLASELVENRTDPFDPKGLEKRALMITTFTPVNCGSVHSTSYFPNATAEYDDELFGSFGIPSGTFESFQIQTQAQISSQPTGGYPVVLFSPAVGSSRLMYTSLLQNIASNGFAVISVDHPYDSNIVEYPDGRTVIGVNISTTPQYDFALKVRVQDMVFLRDQLSNKTAIRSIFPSGAAHLSLDQVTIIGHSLGGATAAQTILVDNRFAGGINLDGSFWGSVATKGLTKPFLLWGHTNHTRATDSTWTSFWNNSTGWKREIQLAQSEHWTFSDFPVLVDSLSISEEDREVIQAGYVGTIGALRARNVISVYVVAALRYFVFGQSSGLLDGSDVSYPDVSFFS